MPSFIIEADRLVKFYGKAKEPALDELGLKVPEGKIFTLLGRNGAGKTTFLRIATTQLLPTSGSIRVFGLDALEHPKGDTQTNRHRATRSQAPVDPQRLRPRPPLLADARAEPF